MPGGAALWCTVQARDDGKTKPHNILRNLTTKEGQVGCPCPCGCAAPPRSTGLALPTRRCRCCASFVPGVAHLPLPLLPCTRPLPPPRPPPPSLHPPCPTREQVFSLQQGRRDIDAIYSMGLFEDVAMRPQPAEGSSLENPKVGEGGGMVDVGWG